MSSIGIAPGANETIEAIARLVQVSLTPIFLLSALAALLGVFSGRLARVADRVDQISRDLETATPDKAERLVRELAYQHQRLVALDVAVVVGAFGGVMTCGSVLVLFVGAVSGLNAARVLFVLFGGAVLAAIVALLAFGWEMTLASGIVRLRSRKAMADGQDTADLQG